MKIITCYKWVLDEADLKVDPASRALLTNRAKSKISEYDKNAIECAVQLVEKFGGEVVALTAGTANAKNSLKDALSRGPEEAVFINDPIMEQADSFVTAKVLAMAINKIGEYDLIICGEGSSDNYGQQVGPRIAQLLGLPVVTYVNKVTNVNGSLRVERKLEEGIEVVEVTLPAVITVLPDINTPRIPSLKQILAASKKKVEEWTTQSLGFTAKDLEPKMNRTKIVGAVTERKNIKLQGEVSEVVAQVVDVLKKEGLC